VVVVENIAGHFLRMEAQNYVYA